MPIIQGAIKRVRQAEKATKRNRDKKVAMRLAIRSAKEAIEADAANKGKLIQEAVRHLDKAARTGLVHKNAAARQKSRLMKQA